MLAVGQGRDDELGLALNSGNIVVVHHQITCCTGNSIPLHVDLVVANGAVSCNVLRNERGIHRSVGVAPLYLRMSVTGVGDDGAGLQGSVGIVDIVGRALDIVPLLASLGCGVVVCHHLLHQLAVLVGVEGTLILLVVNILVGDVVVPGQLNHGNELAGSVELQFVVSLISCVAIGVGILHDGVVTILVTLEDLTAGIGDLACRVQRLADNLRVIALSVILIGKQGRLVEHAALVGPLCTGGNGAVGIVGVAIVCPAGGLDSLLALAVVVVTVVIVDGRLVQLTRDVGLRFAVVVVGIELIARHVDQHLLLCLCISTCHCCDGNDCKCK